jgi:hypothetical protein
MAIDGNRQGESFRKPKKAKCAAIGRLYSCLYYFEVDHKRLILQLCCRTQGCARCGGLRKVTDLDDFALGLPSPGSST